MANTWLIGAGPMARDYIKVLEGTKTDYLIIGRGNESAKECEKVSTKPVRTGGLSDFLISNPTKPEFAIIAVPVEELAKCAITLMDYGVKYILIEKPAGIDKEEIKTLNQQAIKHQTKLILAYNRRFYASTLTAQEMIKQDGGVTSANFEFTEWSHIIEKLNKPRTVFQKWFLGNSTHVVDLAFHLAGTPKKLSAYTAGELPWHSSASIFAGAGTTTKGALFSYNANWTAPGRWQVEILTRKHRYIFKPMEELKIIKTGSVKEEDVEIDYTLDRQYKPGLFKQTEAFLNKDFSLHCDIEEQDLKIENYYRMANYE